MFVFSQSGNMKIKSSKYVFLFFHFTILGLVMEPSFARSFVPNFENSTLQCVVLDIEFVIKFTAFNGTVKIASHSITQDNVSTVFGSCDPMEITVSFTDGSNWTFRFHRVSNGNILLDRTVQFVPDSVFGSYVNDRDAFLVSDDGMDGSFDPPFSYKCYQQDVSQYRSSALTPRTLNYTVEVTVNRIQIQGYSVHNGTSSSIECLLQGNTTTLTSDITATIPPQTSVNKYYVRENNITCIALEGAISISIDYNSSNSVQEIIKTASVNIPTNSTGTGNCNQTLNSQSLVISFFDNWSLEILFTLDEASANAYDRKYSIANVTLIYFIDKQIFPNSTTPPGTEVHIFPQSSKDTNFPRKSGKAAFYKCSSYTQLRLDSWVTVHTTDLLFKAFNTNNDLTFSGDADECSADHETSQVIPITVGCVLGAIVLVMTAIYYICKYRKSKTV